MIIGNLTTNQIHDVTSCTLLLPFGAFEQHGPYLPLLTDSHIAEEICKFVEKRDSESILLLPTLWFGCSSEHEGFDGTISVGVIDMITLLKSMFTSLASSGFTKLIVYNAHGGNRALSDAACEEFSRQSSLKVKSLFAFTPRVDEKIEELFVDGSEPHAGSVETSIYYALRPDQTKTTDKVIEKVDKYDRSKRFSLYPMKEISNSGILNNSTTLRIDAVSGNKIVNVMIEELVKNIEKLG